MPTDKHSKDLALGIVDFLKTSIADGSITADDAESVEVASTYFRSLSLIYIQKKKVHFLT